MTDEVRERDAIVTRDSDTVTVKQNPKYPVSEPLPDTVPTFETVDVPPDRREELTKEEKDAIRDWVKDSKPFNNALRHTKDHEYFKGDCEKYENAIAGAVILSDVIERSRLKQGYDVQRGLGPYDVNQIKSAIIERNITGISPILFDEGFTAVSFDDTQSLKYAVADESGEKYIIASSLKQGDMALFIGNENESHNRKQGEILLPAKTGYYVTKIRSSLDDEGNIINFVDVVFIHEKG
ncbi:MAG TPA: ADP-ribosyltransferase [Methanospirillum sp.]|nr:ADP-ribosyltransferase [Methanospirillum sp.]